MEDPLQFASKIGVHYPLAVATEDVKQRFGGSEGLPTTIIYERQGIRRTKVVGVWYTDNIEQALRPLLKKSVDFAEDHFSLMSEMSGSDSANPGVIRLRRDRSNRGDGSASAI